MTAFQIDFSDNVATALEEISPGWIELRGDAQTAGLEAMEKIPEGHKIALRILHRAGIS